MYSSVPARVGRDLTSISISIFGSGICFCTVELANSTIVVKGVPLQGLTWSSIARFGSRRCFCTLKLATSTIEAKGVFLCGSVTRARSHPQFHY